MISFVKMQGIGNDYIYLDARESIPLHLSDLARRMSNRHFGIGADGVVLITSSESCDFGMRIFNADGSEAQMCGNASRCIAKYVYERGLTKKTLISLETRAGVKYLSLHLNDEGRVASVEVDMGVPLYNGKTTLFVADRPYEYHAVDMGNPHAVYFVSSESELAQIETLGRILECHPNFPDRTNVEFVFIQGEHAIKMRVWERGSGETLACGTGACAAVVAASEQGLLQSDAVVHLPGGDLNIRLDSRRHIMMNGPAEFVYEGQWSE